MNDYQPISCKLHSEYELLAIRQKTVYLQLAGKHERLMGKILDIYTRERVEYLLLETASGDSHEIRLDSINSLNSGD
ncbi:MAG: Rho-binding antiterminator [Candidatus Sedimenticola sp. (ex Thyasira tokunagai)]